MPQLARDISQAASRAHKVIDAPTQLFYYGPCPDCGEDILQERVHHTDTDTKIKCRYLSCGYNQPVDIHQQTILNGCLDLWMTVKEMVGVFDLGGVTVTRDQINGWIRRGRLTKGPGAAEWRNGVLVVAEEGAATYRVRDVLPLAQAANEKRRNTNLHPK